MADYKVTDEGDPRRYYTQLPNSIDDSDLSVYAFRLYVHLKRVAGDSGKCWQSVTTLAEACKMSRGKIVDARKELEKAGLIKTEQVDNPRGGRDFVSVAIADIWKQNAEKYTSSPHEHASSRGEQASSPHELTSSPHELKNNPIKNNSIKKNAEPPPPREETAALTAGQLFLLQSLGAKRFKNKVQAQAARELEEKYGLETFKQGVSWAATNGFDLGRTVGALKTALPKWGQPKANGRQPARASPDLSNSYAEQLKRKLQEQENDSG